MTERVWVVTIETNGFISSVFIRATEERLRKYIDGELPMWTGYHAVSEDEAQMMTRLIGLPIYCY